MTQAVEADPVTLVRNLLIEQRIGNILQSLGRGLHGIPVVIKEYVFSATVTFAVAAAGFQNIPDARGHVLQPVDFCLRLPDLQHSPAEIAVLPNQLGYFPEAQAAVQA